MSDLTMFSYEGAELRTLTIDGEPWFSAPDACQMLGLRDTTSALKMVDNDDKQRLRRSEATSGVIQLESLRWIGPSVRF